MPFVCCQLERVQFKVTGDYQKILRRKCKFKAVLTIRIMSKMLCLNLSVLEQVDFATTLIHLAHTESCLRW